MLKTEKILNSYGLTFGEAEELLQIDVLTSLMQAKDKGGDQLALQVATLDERVAEYLNSSAIKTILEENRKEAIGQDEDELDIDLSDFDLDLDDLDSASGFDVRVTDFDDIEIDLEDLDDAETDDEDDEETSSPPPPMVTTPKPSPKEKGMANAIVFENVPATNFFSQIVKNKVPEVDSDGALVVKFGDLRVRALLDETFVRLGAMPLNSADFRVEVVSMDAEKVVEYNGMFGEGQAQKMEKGVLSLATEEVSQVFNTQQYLVGGAEINTSFDGITTILKKANLKDEYDLGLLDFPLGKAVHPLMVWRSNYFIEPKTLYALANCDEFFSASVGGYRYITNYCEANDLKQLRIFEIGGPHLNVPFDDTRGETITNSVIQDDFSVFSGRVGGIIGDTYSRNEVLYEVGFTQVLPKDIQYDKVDSLSERAGYFVLGSHNSARTFYIPAVVYNYFKKFYGVEDVLAGMKPNSGLFTLYFRKGFDIQGFIMIDESNAPSSAPARLLPTDAVEYMEEIVGMNAVAFTDKINIEEDESVTFLGEVKSRPEDGLKRVFEEQIALFEQALEFMDEGEDDAEIATLKEAIEGARIMLEDDIDEQAEEEILESIDMIPEEEDELGQVAVANDQDILPTPSADDPVVEDIIEQEKEDVLDEEDDMDIVFIDKMPDLPEGEEILVNPEPTFDDDDLDDDDDIEINEIDLDFAKGGKTGKYTIHLSKDLGLDDEFRYHVVGPDGGVIGCQSKKECQEVISLAKRGMIEMEKGGAVPPRKTSIKKIMDGVRGSNGGPFTIIAFKDGKLLAQRSRRYPEEIPLVVEAIRKLFQNAKIEVEDGGGQIIYQSTPTRERSFAKGGKTDDVDALAKQTLKKWWEYYDEMDGKRRREKELAFKEFKKANKVNVKNDYYTAEVFVNGEVVGFAHLVTDRTQEPLKRIKYVSYGYAKGGVLDKEFKFDKNFVIYVPSTSNVGDKISSSEMGERVSEVEELVANEFGGFTKTETDGGYKASSGDIVEEDIVKVSVFSTDEAWEKNEKRLIRAIKIWAKEWGQEAIGFEYEGDLYYIDAKGKMAKGGKTMTPSDIVSLLTDEEVAKELVDKMFETLESVDFDVDEKTALTQAKDNIEHSRKMLIEILEHQA